MKPPAPVDAVIDHDARTVTVAITFQWGPPNVLVLDHCEAAGFLGQMRRALVNWLQSTDHPWAAPTGPIQGFSYQCFEPHEERQLGYIAGYGEPTCTLCGGDAVMIDNPPWYLHREDTDCRSFVDQVGDEDGNIVRFPNRLAVDLTKCGREDW